MKVAILYVVGSAVLAFGFYEVWYKGKIDQNAFTIGAVCIVSAAAIQIIRDLLRRLRR